MSVIFWLACQTAPEKEPQAPPEAESNWPEASIPEDDFEFVVSDIQAALMLAVSTLPTWSAEDAFVSYDGAMSWSDEYCPYNTEYDGNALWYGGCNNLAPRDGYLFETSTPTTTAEMVDAGMWISFQALPMFRLQRGRFTTVVPSILKASDGLHTAISVMAGPF